MDRTSSPAAGFDESTSDRQLVEATLAGDVDALAALHRRYYGRVYRLALVRCRCGAQDAEDIAAETFVRALTHLGGYRFQGESLFPWLARIATNLAADQSRRTRGISFVSLDGDAANDAVRALVDAIPSNNPDPHELAERHEVRALIRAAIGALPGDQADAILLRFGGDMSLKEIALSMNKSEGAIKSLLHRAIGNLRTALSTGETAAAVFGNTREGAGSVKSPTQTSPQHQYGVGTWSHTGPRESEVKWKRSDTS